MLIGDILRQIQWVPKRRFLRRNKPPEYTSYFIVMWIIQNCLNTHTINTAEVNTGENSVCWINKKRQKVILTPFPPIMTCVLISHQHMFLGSLYCKQYGQWSVWSGFIVFASLIKYGLKCTWIFAADVKSIKHLKGKIIGKKRVKTSTVCLNVSFIYVHV